MMSIATMEGIWNVMRLAYMWLARMDVGAAFQITGAVKLVFAMSYAIINAYTPRFLETLFLVRPVDTMSGCMKHREDQDVLDMCRERINKKISDLLHNYSDGTAIDAMIWLAVLLLVILFRITVQSHGIRNHLMLTGSIVTSWMTMGIVHAGMAYHYIVTQPTQPTQPTQIHQKEIHSAISVLSVLISMVIVWRNSPRDSRDSAGDRGTQLLVEEHGAMLAEQRSAIMMITDHQEESRMSLRNLEDRVRALESPRKQLQLT